MLMHLEILNLSLDLYFGSELFILILVLSEDQQSWPGLCSCPKIRSSLGLNFKFKLNFLSSSSFYLGISGAGLSWLPYLQLSSSPYLLSRLHRTKGNLSLSPSDSRPTEVAYPRIQFPSLLLHLVQLHLLHLVQLHLHLVQLHHLHVHQQQVLLPDTTLTNQFGRLRSTHFRWTQKEASSEGFPN